MVRRRGLSGSRRAAESGCIPYIMVEWMLQQRPPPLPAEPSAVDAIPTRPLSAAFVRCAPAGRHADGNGLYLFVQPTGNAKLGPAGSSSGDDAAEMGLGAAGLVSLAEAREQALANRKLARSGGDPLSDRRRAEGVPTFAEAAQRVLEQKRGGWRGRWHAQNWWRSMERYVFPRIGQRPVSEVNTADVLEILSPIWHAKAETARAVRQRIRSVLEWAVALDMRSDNPCDRVLTVLGAQNDIVTHRQALPHRGGGRGHRDGAGVQVRPAGRQARIRVSRADRGAIRRGAAGYVGRDGRGRPRVDDLGPADEGEARAPRSAVPPGVGDSRRGAGRSATAAASCSRCGSGRAIALSTLPKVLRYHEIAAVPHGFRSSFPRLGGGGNRPPAGGDRGGAGARGPRTRSRAAYAPVGTCSSAGGG